VAKQPQENQPAEAIDGAVGDAVMLHTEAIVVEKPEAASNNQGVDNKAFT
jgi:hypothetical protein